MDTNSIMSPIIPPQYRSILRFEAKLQVLICRLRGQGIGKDVLGRHLRTQHQIKGEQRSKTLINFHISLNGSSPIADLAVHRGFKCERCPVLTRSDEIVKKHIRTMHGLPCSSIGTDFQAISLQAWFKNTRAKY